MSVRVIASADPRSLDRDPRFLALTGHIHLFATRTMQRGWEQSPTGRRMRLRHLSFRGVLKRLLHPWYSPAVTLQQYANLSKTITGLPVSPRRQAFSRSQASVLDAIRTLIEAGLSPTDYRSDEDDAEMFRELWSTMEAEDALLARPRKRLYTAPDSFLQRFAEALNEPDGHRPEQGNPERLLAHRTLVLHGFYFVSPIQYRIFELLNEAGVELIFFNHYDPRLPKIFSIWHRYFGDARYPLLPAPSQWELPETMPVLPAIAQSFGELIAGRTDRPISHDPDRVSIRRFGDFGSFLQHLPTTRKTLPRLYAPGHGELSAILRDFYPPESARQEQHFLAYPVGQLLFHLHRMWDPEREALRLETQALRECFASGWLQIGGVNGRDRLHDLESLLPFFEGCQSLWEWNTRARDLVSCVEGAAGAFSTPVPSSNPNHRFHRFLSNPLLRLSYLRVPERHVREVHDLIRRLSEIARLLFNDMEVSLHEHFERIQREILDHVPEQALLARERELLVALRARLTEDADPDTRFLTRDLAKAISYFLGGELLEDPEDARDRPLVERFDGLDGVIFDDGSKETWLCLLSEDALPRSGSGLDWPIRARALEHLEDNPFVALLHSRSRYAREADVMLFFMALAWSSGRLSLSWISSWKGQERVASPLVSLLMATGDLLGDSKLGDVAGAPGGVSVEKLSAASWTPEGEPAPDTTLGLREPFDATTLPFDVQATAALCVRRFFYSFVASEFPSFQSDFHHGFLFGNLARATALVGSTKQSPLTVAGALEHVRKLFPAWNDLQVRASIESTPGPRGGFSPYDGVSYPNARARLQFLVERDGHPIDIATGRDEDARQAAIAALEEAMTLDIAGLPQARPSEGCRYCPHIGRCDAAQFHMEGE